MRVAEFCYDLPESLIAQRPAARRTASRLLSLEGSSGEIRDLRFTDLALLLRPGDLLVLNDTRVVRARLVGRKSTGGRVEILIERVIDDRRCLALVRASKAPRADSRIQLDGGVGVSVAGRQGDLFELCLEVPGDWHAVMADHGQVPLPPYIQRRDEAADAERYQTVYARHPGAVAAPTAGLHFDQALLDTLAARGVARAFVTLHVGAGTFQPVRAERIEDHRMHAERAVVDESVCAAVRAARAGGGRVVAVGTTCVRALESAAAEGSIAPLAAETSMFILPGYRFRCVDAMITNFHLPASTLLMLVCAFAGTGQVLDAYRHAVRERYRFFSYGDAMFVTRRG